MPCAVGEGTARSQLVPEYHVIRFLGLGKLITLSEQHVACTERQQLLRGRRKLQQDEG